MRIFTLVLLLTIAGCDTPSAPTPIHNDRTKCLLAGGRVIERPPIFTCEF